MNTIQGGPFSPNLDAALGYGGQLDLTDRESSLPRLWRAFMTARIGIAVGLLLMMGYLMMVDQPAPAGVLILCVVYLMITLVVRVWGRPMLPGVRFDPQWLATIGVDVAVFALLLYFKIGQISYIPLLLMPILLASVLGPLLLAWGTVAVVTLVLLFDALQYTLAQLPDAIGHYVQAAVMGTSLFALAYLINLLAVRLVRQENVARGNEIAARVQIQVNERIIDALSDGVLVVDVNGTVHAANPAGRAILGVGNDGDRVALPAPFALAQRNQWQALATLAAHTFAQRKDVQRDLVIDDGQGRRRMLHVKTYLSRVSGMPALSSLCVMFLHDLREMQARVRTEKLAAMGRMSAAVAHEIRNPLSAIAQANALLAEDGSQAGRLKLVDMVAQNVQRLNRVVEDILDVVRVRGASDRSAQLDNFAAHVREIVSDWAGQNAALHNAQEVLRVEVEPCAVALEFDLDHLRRVLVNLLDNALRNASLSKGSVRVSFRAEANAERWRLSVWSDGAPIEQSIERHLFEPFFSSQSRSSGLGLFICRELCMRHGASIAYERTPRKIEGGRIGETTGNEFVLLIRACRQVQRRGQSQAVSAG